MATGLAYLKSKLLLPGTPEEEFKVLEVAEKLKLQLKKLELIRLLSEQMLKRKRLGREIRTRGIRSGIKPVYNSELKVTLFDLMKTYSTIIMTKDFQKMNIPKLPVFTTEEGIKTIKEFFGKLKEWKKLDELIPNNFKNKIYKNTGKAGIFAGSLELVKEGNIKIKQKDLFDDIFIRQNKWLKKNKKKDNIIDFPSKLSSIEKEIEAIVFAAAEPLDVQTIQEKISKKTDVESYF